MQVIKQQYLDHKKHIASLLEENIDLANKWQAELKDIIDVSDLIEDLVQIKNNFTINRFEIVVVGEFSTGKSTFINALIGKKVLPSKAMPTTATVNFIRHLSEDVLQEEGAVVYFDNGESTRVYFQELEQFVTEMSEKHSVVDEIKYVDIFVNSPFLEDGVVIIDTPGMKSLHKKHDEITHKQIRSSNASIFLFDINRAGSRTEYEFLQKVKESINRIFFVGNRCDEVNEEDQTIEEVIHSVELKLQENDYYKVEPTHAKVYPVSSQQALLARDSSVSHGRKSLSNEELLQRSRFAYFEVRLWEYLTTGEKTQEEFRDTIFKVTKFFEVISKLLADRLNALTGEIDLDDYHMRMAAIQENIEIQKLKLENDKAEIMNQVSERTDKQRIHFEEGIQLLKVELVRNNTNFESFDEYNECYEQTEQMIHYHFNDYVHKHTNKLRVDIMNLVTKKLKASSEEFERNFPMTVDTIQINTRLKKKQVGEHLDVKRIQNELKELQDEKVRFERNLEDYDNKIEYYEKHESKKLELERTERRFENEYSSLQSTINSTSSRYDDYDTPEFKGLAKVLGWIGFERKQRKVNRIDNSKDQLIKKAEELEASYKEKLNKLEAELDNAAISKLDKAVVKKDKLEQKIEELNANYKQAKDKLYSKQIEASNNELAKMNKEIESMIEQSTFKIVSSYREIMNDMNFEGIVDYFYDKYLEQNNEKIAVLIEELGYYEKLLQENEQTKQLLVDTLTKIETTIQQKNEEFNETYNKLIPMFNS